VDLGELNDKGIKGLIYLPEIVTCFIYIFTSNYWNMF
jgi:hypothetical protein